MLSLKRTVVICYICTVLFVNTVQFVICYHCTVLFVMFYICNVQFVNTVQFVIFYQCIVLYVITILPQNALKRDCNGKCIE